MERTTKTILTCKEFINPIKTKSMKKINLLDPCISLKLGETFTNKGPRKDVQILYYNAVGIRSTSFKTLETGESITKTHSDTIIHIFLTQ